MEEAFFANSKPRQVSGPESQYSRTTYNARGNYILPTRDDPGEGPSRKQAVSEVYLEFKDKLCDSNWPLANLWPVYVGNFPCKQVHQRDRTIRTFFASKGLLVRWWFSLSDDYFHQFQSRANLYDMLVYFASEYDVRSAIQRFNQSVHNGYTLNVFPGRKPIFFPPETSLLYNDMRFGFTLSEEFLARHLAPHGNRQCVVKFDISSGAVEFCTVESCQAAFENERLLKPQRVLKNSLQKQRFVEQNVREEIAAYIRDNPEALTIDPGDVYVQKLRSGEKLKPLDSYGPPIIGPKMDWRGKPEVHITPFCKNPPSYVKNDYY